MCVPENLRSEAQKKYIATFVWVHTEAPKVKKAWVPKAEWQKNNGRNTNDHHSSRRARGHRRRHRSDSTDSEDSRDYRRSRRSRSSRSKRSRSRSASHSRSRSRDTKEEHGSNTTSHSRRAVMFQKK